MLEEAIWDLTVEGLGIEVFPLELPPSVTLPACTYQRISTVREYTHNGDALLERLRYQFDVYTETYQEAREYSDALRDTWSGYSGQVYESPDIFISAAFILGDRDLYEPEPACYHVSTDVSMWVRIVL